MMSSGGVDVPVCMVGCELNGRSYRVKGESENAKLGGRERTVLNNFISAIALSQQNALFSKRVPDDFMLFFPLGKPDTDRWSLICIHFYESAEGMVLCMAAAGLFKAEVLSELSSEAYLHIYESLRRASRSYEIGMNVPALFAEGEAGEQIISGYSFHFLSENSADPQWRLTWTDPHEQPDHVLLKFFTTSLIMGRKISVCSHFPDPVGQKWRLQAPFLTLSPHVENALELDSTSFSAEADFDAKNVQLTEFTIYTLLFKHLAKAKLALPISSANTEKTLLENLIAMFGHVRMKDRAIVSKAISCICENDNLGPTLVEAMNDLMSLIGEGYDMESNPKMLKHIVSMLHDAIIYPSTENGNLSRFKATFVTANLKFMCQERRLAWRHKDLQAGLAIKDALQLISSGLHNYRMPNR